MVRSTENRPKPCPTPRRRRRPRRGIALLLVMIALVVGTLLTAGFLATQGTSLGIAHNQRDHDRARALAESGVDLGAWLIKNRTDWREAMTPANWLDSYALHGGTVTLAAADGKGANDFATDNTHAVTLTSKGTYDGRTFTVTASLTPSGGGMPWSGGTFAAGQMILNNSALVDSYNSSLGGYGGANKGLNAQWWSNYNGVGALQVWSTQKFGGNFMTLPNPGAFAVWGDVTKFPYGTAAAPETRTLGTIVPSNTTGFTSTGDYTQSGTTTLAPANISYKNFTINGGSVTIQQNAVLLVREDLLLDHFALLKIDTGCQVIIVVAGNTNVHDSTVQIMNQGRLTIYAGGGVTVYGSSKVNWTGSAMGTPASMMLLGQAGCGAIQMQNTALWSGAVYAPQADCSLTDSAQFLGSMVVRTMSLQKSSKMHFDEALKTVPLHNIVGGSTMGDYRMAWQQ